ncbi:MAG: alanine racemase [Clostridia bacterium]|nr:alanine racemase [Clostridia bacterium]
MLSVQVNFRTILKNVATIKKHLKPGTKFCAVVKSNAYGLGLKRISKLLAPHVDCFAVATLNEAIELRQNGITQDILLFGICENINTAIKNDIIITVESSYQAKLLHKKKLHPRIHLAVNTGMNRFGISSVHELRETLQILKHDRIEGVYTHLAFESDNLDAVQQALTRFKKYTSICQKHFPYILVHAGCSGVVSYRPAHFDMIRIGKALYGGIPETKTALTVTSQIVAVQKIKEGMTIGYNGTYTASRPTVIGIVRTGYAEGIPMQLSNTATVLIAKQSCPIIGRICMDYCFIDVSKVTNPLNKLVTFVCQKQKQTLLDMAQKAQMVTCDLLLNITRKQNFN